jgi:hypothetical protein
MQVTKIQAFYRGVYHVRNQTSNPVFILLVYVLDIITISIL